MSKEYHNPNNLGIFLPKPFEELLARKHTYYVYHSGRGCAKSVSIIRCLLLISTTEKIRILCVREVMSSIAESVKAEIENQISQMNLNALFTSTRDSVRCINGSEFIFRGLRDHNAINIKSISNIGITFVEEAEALSWKSYEMLLPSVLRGQNAKEHIIFALNPRYEEDVIYSKFIANTPPPKSFVQKLTQNDNPWFCNTNLATQMIFDSKTMPKAEFKHKWLGELLTAADDCLFTEEAIANMKKPYYTLPREAYVRVVIGIDPATTAKEHSNEYGIVVCAATPNGEYFMLENASKRHSPHSFAMAVSRLYKKYDADCVVVETNAGGDFIKATIMLYDKTIRVKEVRAIKDKVHRAQPVANLAALDRITLHDYGREELIRQMRNITLRGYTGPRGSSPDSLDALVWAIYDLAGIEEGSTEGLLFQKRMFGAKEELGDYGFFKSKIALAHSGNLNFCIIEAELWESTTLKRAVNITSASVVERGKIHQFIQTLEVPVVYMPEDEEVRAERISYYERTKLSPLSVSATITTLSSSKIIIENAEVTRWGGFEGNILLRELLAYNEDKKGDIIVVEAFINLLLNVL